MKTIYYCELCGKECVANYKSQVKKFCSHKCANISRWSNHQPDMTVIKCQVCGKDFEVQSCDYRLSHGGIKYCSKECSYIGSQTGKMIECKNCKKFFYSTRHSFCSRECASQYRSEHTEHKTYYENGYIIEYHKGYNKKGNVKQHRRIMEEYLGRKLTSDEVVHHKNGNKKDNRIANLDVMTRGEHSSLHRKQEREKRGINT